jgi:hypothetical protein
MYYIYFSFAKFVVLNIKIDKEEKKEKLYREKIQQYPLYLEDSARDIKVEILI